MMIVPAGVKVHLALGYTDMRKGMDGLADAGPGRAQQGSVLGPSFCFPGQARKLIMRSHFLFTMVRIVEGVGALSMIHACLKGFA